MASTDGIRENIVETLQTLLQSVTTGNGYQQNIEEVLDYPTHFEDLTALNFPVASIFMGSETGEVLLGNSFKDYTLNIGLRCYVEGADEETIRQSANMIVEDINKLIFNNITLGISEVIDTNVLSNDAPFIWLDVGNLGHVDIQLQVMYRRPLV